jgi:O-antigen biosynthesis protein
MAPPTTASLRPLPDCLDAQTPIAVRTIDLETDLRELQLPASVSGRAYRTLLALIRNDRHPLGWMTFPVSDDGTVDLTADAKRPLPRRAPRPTEARSHKQAQPQRDDPPPTLSVVVTTCADVARVMRCIDAILACEHEVLEIVVVENRPILSRLQRALDDRFSGDQRIRYVEEHRRGLSRARNAGLYAARGEFVAFTDDDILVDEAWACAIADAFQRSAMVDCITGPILPLELETDSQVLVERFASFGKGFEQRTYSMAAPPVDQPLFPYTAGYFGSGANMAFRASALRRLGGFDPALGAGTSSRAGEDLDVCIRLLHAGGELLYEPRAIVSHRHPDTTARLRGQVFGYGVGLGAMLFKQLLLGPQRSSILARAPQGVRYFTDPRSRKNISRGSVFPRALSRLERIGLAWGPCAYLASRWVYR